MHSHVCKYSLYVLYFSSFFHYCLIHCLNYCLCSEEEYFLMILIERDRRGVYQSLIVNIIGVQSSVWEKGLYLIPFCNKSFLKYGKFYACFPSDLKMFVNSCVLISSHHHTQDGITEYSVLSFQSSRKAEVVIFSILIYIPKQSVYIYIYVLVQEFNTRIDLS